MLRRPLKKPSRPRLSIWLNSYYKHVPPRGSEHAYAVFAIFQWTLETPPLSAAMPWITPVVQNLWSCPCVSKRVQIYNPFRHCQIKMKKTFSFLIPALKSISMNVARRPFFPNDLNRFGLQIYNHFPFQQYFFWRFFYLFPMQSSKILRINNPYKKKNQKKIVP